MTDLDRLEELDREELIGYAGARLRDRDYWHGVATKAKDQRDAAIARAERAEAAIERVRASANRYPNSISPRAVLAALDTGKEAGNAEH